MNCINKMTGVDLEIRLNSFFKKSFDLRKFTKLPETFVLAEHSQLKWIKSCALFAKIYMHAPTQIIYITHTHTQLEEVLPWQTW